ncbi:MAG: hypothetical protein ACE5HW_02550 [Candidatus Methanofastidiosia archaeon]
MKLIQRLLENDKTYSSELGIDVAENPFKWFLVSVLFGARISEDIASRTFKEFEKAEVTTPEEILKTSRDRLIEILDSGGYVRYDFKTAEKLLEMSKNLKERYGKIERLKDDPKIEEKLMGLAKGIGEVTINIFLREMRGVWNVEPELSKYVIQASKNLGLIEEEGNALEELKKIFKENKVENFDFRNFEVALLRLSKNFCRKKRCSKCRVSKLCKSS